MTSYFPDTYDLQAPKLTRGITRGEPKSIMDYSVENKVYPGMGVIWGSTDYTVAIPTLSTQKFAGILLYSKITPQRYTSTLDFTSECFFVEGQIAPVLRSGQVAVLVITDVSAHDKVYVAYSATENEIRGNFTNSATANGGAVILVPSGEFLTSAKSGSLAIVNINLPTNS